MAERADELRARIIDNVAHIARGCRAHTSHEPAVHVNAIADALDELLAGLEALKVRGDELGTIVVELARFSRVAVENGDLHARAASALALWEEAASGGGSDA